MATMEQALKRAVTLPVDNPTLSYWQTPPSQISELRTTEELPPTVDFAIIGSGISGASVARFLVLRNPGARVIILEARGACSGATGRNGGHTKAASFRTWAKERDNVGDEEAARIARLEWANIIAQRQLVSELNIDCDMRATQTVDIFYDENQIKSFSETVTYMNESIPGELERYTVLGAEKARSRFLCPDALGAIVYEAGSASAYQLASGVLKDALARGLNLQTHTPVTKLEQDASRNLWKLHTPRGIVCAPTTILATNAYTAALLPEMHGTIVPMRGQISVQRPGTNLPCPLPATYTFSYADGYEYMVTRPDGDIVIGGGWASLPDSGASECGTTDDSVINADVSAYLHDCTARYFGANNWGADQGGGRVRAEWSGIIAQSADNVPYVGEVPGRSGLWASVSFNGHGMALAYKCAEALTSMIAREEEGLHKWFPNSFRMHPKRIGMKYRGLRN